MGGYFWGTIWSISEWRLLKPPLFSGSVSVPEPDHGSRSQGAGLQSYPGQDVYPRPSWVLFSLLTATRLLWQTPVPRCSDTELRNAFCQHEMNLWAWTALSTSRAICKWQVCWESVVCGCCVSWGSPRSRHQGGIRRMRHLLGQCLWRIREMGAKIVRESRQTMT